ncbi:hypothetical protein TNIN_36931 [Trichonephila inaurata madagascariensis]|uniref:Uncharacterized protein n=1 Tax=Trichonephila inaurata madagascariensis TaxID=2747483 RepID=A0A8X6Y5T1_9ARAC|nr:hypothetical protein TNIN_36931 [Trichonephila inaurata madagascariensis]
MNGLDIALPFFCSYTGTLFRTENFIILNMETKGAKPFPKSPIYCFLNHSAERIRNSGDTAVNGLAYRSGEPQVSVRERNSTDMELDFDDAEFQTSSDSVLGVNAQTTPNSKVNSPCASGLYPFSRVV